MKVKYKKINAILLFLNLSIVALLFFWLDGGKLLFSIWIVIIVIELSLFLAVLKIKSISEKLENVILNANLIVFSLLSLLLLIEVSGRIFYTLLPPSILSFYTKTNRKEFQEYRNSILEYMPESPFVKFKSSATIRSPGFRGTEKQFVYEWKTDRYGFKNLPGLDERKEIEIFSIGDSFTEGMGVDTAATWQNILTERGFPVYNAGVQAYAPTQIEGVYKKYGSYFKAKYLVFGYTRGTFVREKFFKKLNDSIKNGTFDGNLENYREIEQGRDVKIQSNSLVIAISYLLKSFSGSIPSQNSGIKRYLIKFPVMEKYSKEIQTVSGDDPETRNLSMENPEFKRLFEVIESLELLAKKRNSKFVFLYFPERAEIYFEKATGEKIPASSFGETEKRYLKKFSIDHGIKFIDPTDRLKKYLSELKSPGKTEDLPYLEIDAHMSKKGHQLVSEEIYFSLFNKR